MTPLQSVIKTVIGSTVRIVCTITLNTGIGNDISVINQSWYFNDATDTTNKKTELKTSPGKVFVTTLNISSVQLSNAGVYECRVNIVGSSQVIKNTTHLCALG